MRLIGVAVVLTLNLFVMPHAVEAQQAGKVARVGVIGLTGPGSMDEQVYKVFRARLAELGWIEGKNLVFESRWADGKVDRLPGFINELVVARADVIYGASTPVAIALKKGAPSIPVVFSHVSDPIASGVIQTLSRPGGNITGVSYTAPEAAGKLVQLISEFVPSIRRVVVLWNKANHAKVLEMDQVMTASRILSIDITSLDFSGPNDYPTAFNQIPTSIPTR